MIEGMHAMFYTSEAKALREFIRDKLGLDGTDVGDGWLIFDVPNADLGIHPTGPGSPPPGTAGISFFCRDIEGTVAQLKSKGVEFTQTIEDHGYGLPPTSRCRAASPCSSTNRATGGSDYGRAGTRSPLR